MNKKMSKRQRDLKAKLMAAIAMLLVSSIMMVSTTYAWFTLSTAPEVTGITTAVGSNGNLEMALLPLSGDTAQITTGTNDSTKPDKERNVTWGNLVDLSDDSYYGLSNIVLYPTALNLNQDGTHLEMGSPLQYPQYGADGRISSLNSTGAQFGKYDATKAQFYPEADGGTGIYGVRAIGSASGMTNRELAYRAAKNGAYTRISDAAGAASKTLNTNGSALAAVAIKYGADGEAAKFDSNDKTSMQKLLTDLANAETGPYAYLRDSYKQFLIAMVLSNESGLTDGEADTFYANAKDKSLSEVQAMISSTGATMPTGYDAFTANIATMEASFAKVAEAQAALDALGDSGNYTYTQFATVLTKIANPSGMLIGTYTPEQFKALSLTQMLQVIANGVQVTMSSGSGVFADIADQSTDYTAQVTIESGEFKGESLAGMTITMKTAATSSVLGSIYSGWTLTSPSSTAGGAAKPITDTYGYVIDMAFRTNAAGSKLTLQPEAKNRIYSGQEGVEMADGQAQDSMESTMGNGATMTFKSAGNFSTTQMLNLMDSITVVFFETSSREIVGYAKLDTSSYTTDADGVKVKLGMAEKTTTGGTAKKWVTDTVNEAGVVYTLYYNEQTKSTYTYRSYESIESVEATNTVVTKWQEYKMANVQAMENGQPKFDGEGNPVWEYVMGEDGNPTSEIKQEMQWVAVEKAAEPTLDSLKIDVDVPAGSWAFTGNNEIMELPQNTPVALSALVYLDGEKVTNADVAATGTSSMTGKMSLQFSSSATLQPMNYTPLMQQDLPGANTNGGGETPEQGGGEGNT